MREEISKLDKRITEEITQLRSIDLAKLDKRITDEITQLRTVDLAKLDKRITDEISSLRIELTEKIANTRADIIKWMFIFWGGQIFAILGILLAFFRK